MDITYVFNFSKSIVPAFIAIVPTFIQFVTMVIGAYLGFLFGAKHTRLQKKLDFIERQLREFYSPILGCHKEIRAKSEARVRISQAANQAWQEKCAEEREKSSFHQFDHEKAFEPYKNIIEYENQQFEDELMPVYRNMLEIFRNNYWLAEPETRKWYPELCWFVELWERWLSKNIPAEVIAKLDTSEQRLVPFYQELETRMDVLRKELKGS